MINSTVKKIWELYGSVKTPEEFKIVHKFVGDILTAMESDSPKSTIDKLLVIDEALRASRFK